MVTWISFCLPGLWIRVWSGELEKGQDRACQDPANTSSRNRQMGQNLPFRKARIESRLLNSYSSSKALFPNGNDKSFCVWQLCNAATRAMPGANKNLQPLFATKFVTITMFYSTLCKWGLILPKNGSLYFNKFVNHNLMTLNITVIFHLASMTFIDWKYKGKILILRGKSGVVWFQQLISTCFGCEASGHDTVSISTHWKTFENTQCTCESTFENAQWRKVHDHDAVSISTHWKACNCQASFSHKRTDFDCPNDFGHLSEIYL